jgi:hypothetical protein
LHLNNATTSGNHCIIDYNRQLQSNITQTYLSSNYSSIYNNDGSDSNHGTDSSENSQERSWVSNYGLNEGEKLTDGRRRNPDKYTDKSMYIKLDK